MLTILSVTTPIYLLIAVGFLAVRLGWLSPDDIRSLGRFVARLALPVLIFHVVSTQPLAAVLNARYLAVYGGGSLAAMLLVRAVALARGREGSLAAMQGLGCACGNSAFVGYPIIVQVIGPAAGTALALGLLVENVLMMPLGLALADHRGAGVTRAFGARLRPVLAGLLRNPLFLGILAGIAGAALQLSLPAPVDKAVTWLGQSAPPVSLVVIGGSLVGLRLAGLRGDLGLMVAGKLLLHPLCVGLLVWLLPPAEPALRAAAILFASMPMASVLPILAQRHGHEGFASAALLAVIVTSFATIAVAIALVPEAWVPPRPGLHP